MKKIILSCTLLAVSSFVYSSPQDIVSQCTTKETGGDGVRHSCTSETSRLSAPKNHVFAEKTLTGGKISSHGSKHICMLSWENYVEVIPGSGIMEPTVVALKSHAVGPSRHFSGRGWVSCKYKVKLSKYR